MDAGAGPGRRPCRRVHRQRRTRDQLDQVCDAAIAIIDGEPSKSGLASTEVAGLARAVARLARAFPEAAFVLPAHLNPIVRESLLPPLGVFLQVGFGGRQKEFQLHSRSIVIGSAADCDLRLPFRRHGVSNISSNTHAHYACNNLATSSRVALTVSGGAEILIAVSASFKPCPVSVHTTVSPSCKTPAWCNFATPATDAADAGSQNTPSVAATVA